MLVGRRRELATVRRLFEELVEGRGGALLLQGEAGVGKTALLEPARAAGAGTTVLECRGLESESSLPFAALRDLIAPVVERRDTLPAPQEAALAGALALGPPVPGDRLAVCVAALGVLEAAAADGPLLILVDDLQWLDGPSRECVTYVARRARGPIALLLTARDGHDDRDWEGIPSVRVAPLQPDHANKLIAEAASDLSPEVCQAVLAAAAGNPLALVELPATLTPGQRRGNEPLEHPLAPGRAFERVYARRMVELSPRTREALLVAAACHTSELAPLAAACHSMGGSVEALEEAETSGLVTVAGGHLEFSHPLARGAAYHSASPADRRKAHRALAEAVDGEARAWHLGAAALGPDEEAAGALEEAAGAAGGRRAYAVAAEAFKRAADLSPDPARSVACLLGAGVASLSAGHMEQAAALAGEASDKAGDPLVRAGADHLRGLLTLGTGRVLEALELLERSAESATANPVLAALAFSDAAFAATAAAECERALALAERAAALLDDSWSPVVRAPVLAILAWSLVLRGESRRARPILREVLDVAPELDPFSPGTQLIVNTVNCRLPFEDYEGTLSDVLARTSAAREAGSLYAVPNLLTTAAAAAARLGRWDEAARLCDEGVATAEETGQWGPAGLARIARARLGAARGNEARSRADAAFALALAESDGVRCFRIYGHGAIGFLELSLGNIEAAIAALEETERRAQEAGFEEPTIVPWAPDLVEAYTRAGDQDGARRVLSTLIRQAEGADTPGTAAMAERCSGLVANGDFDEHFDRAVKHHDASPMPFERYRTLLAWGMRLHRARRRADARERLRAAAEGFEELNARPWVELARSELRAAGGRRRRRAGDALSPREERVAREAARGATTREIASELYLSPKTVEFHLDRAYRKLGIHSRRALTAALASREDSGESSKN